MKIYKLLLLFTLLLAFNSSFAQDSLHIAPSQIAKTILDKLDHEVILTNQQKAEVRQVLLERAEKFSQVKQTASAKKLTKADFKQANQQALTKLLAVLSPEQFAKLEALRIESQRQKAAYKEEEIYKSLQDIELDF